MFPERKNVLSETLGASTNEIPLQRGRKSVYLNEGYRERMMEIAMNCYDQKDFETAVYVFRKLVEMNDSRAKNNLAYMIRRKETKGITKPPILEAMMLLKEGIEDKEGFP